jgi:hypothetical protein
LNFGKHVGKFFNELEVPFEIMAEHRALRRQPESPFSVFNYSYINLVSKSIILSSILNVYIRVQGILENLYNNIYQTKA